MDLYSPFYTRHMYVDVSERMMRDGCMKRERARAWIQRSHFCPEDTDFRFVRKAEYGQQSAISLQVDFFLFFFPPLSSHSLMWVLLSWLIYFRCLQEQYTHHRGTMPSLWGAAGIQSGDLWLRKRCLYFFVLLLMILLFMNLAMTIWFSKSWTSQLCK